jgi:hypothetical protein
MTEKRKYLPIAAIAAVALAAAACSNNDNEAVTSESSAPAPAATVTVQAPGPTTGTLAAGDFPEGHGLMEGTESFADGETRVGDTVITCEADEDGGTCELTVAMETGEVSGTPSYSGTYSGGTITLSAYEAPLGSQALTDLGGNLRTLFDDNGVPVVTGGTDGVVGGDDAADDSNAVADRVADMHVDAGKITLAHTTHGTDTIDDMDATVSPASKVSNDPALPDTHLYTGGVEDMGEAVTRISTFMVEAMWRNQRNEADQWQVPAADDMEMDQPAEQEQRMGGGWRMIALPATPIEGGRTVHVDLYSDYNENLQKPLSMATAMEVGTTSIMVTITAAVPDDAQTAEVDESMPLFWRFGLTGDLNQPFDADEEVAIDADVIRFDDANYVSPDDLEAGERQELRPASGDDPTAEDYRAADMVDGTWRGIPGTFHCADAMGGNGNCFIRNQQGGVTSGGVIQFTPAAGAMIVDQDTDWLAAGVWLTIPDDAEEGDYAGGAFVQGSDPFEVSELQALTGTASYAGTAAGRYAENDAGTERSDRFSADAMLTANFGDATAQATDFGTISGELTNFAAMGGADSSTWDVNFDMAMIGDDGRFGDEVTAHSRGHDMDGVWAGQFYGNDPTVDMVAALTAATMAAAGDDAMSPAVQAANDAYVTLLTAAQNHPNSVAGTFGASDRDAMDDYALSLMGVFGAYITVPEQAAQ